MKLSDYNNKRDFTVTKEPKGTLSKTTAKLRFVIQYHEATRNHFDLRLKLALF